MSDPWRVPLSSNDTTGTELPSLKAAKAEAIARIRAQLNSEAGWASANLERYVEITDEHGTVLAVVTFAEIADL